VRTQKLRPSRGWIFVVEDDETVEDIDSGARESIQPS
jgi:hypothetical protein